MASAQFFNFKKIWGNAVAFLDRSRRVGWIDLLVMVGIAGIIFATTRVASEWTGAARPAVEIDLSPWALPKYTLFSLSRGLFAYVLSLGFTLVYGYWAAHDKIAERVLVPMLDILQSIPVLGFMPGLVLALAALFPTSNIGLELAAVIMIFTGQAWNMTFSFYQSVRSVPESLREAATVYRFNWWERFKWVEFPYAALGLVWNSMMSMAGGWFFLMINEAFVLGDKDFRLPGIGSYMSVAVAKGDVSAMVWAVVAMGLMILTLDQILWRPVVVWAQKFRVEESAGAQMEPRSWFLEWLRRSRILQWIEKRREKRRGWLSSRIAGDRKTPTAPQETSRLASTLSVGVFLGLLVLLGLGAWKLFDLLNRVRLEQWASIGLAAMKTLGRVLGATALGTLWAVPAGLAIGLSARLSRYLQPVVQMMASFPAPMLFPAAILFLQWAGIPLGWGSIVLMLLGTQWYILFNVIAGAMAIPADLREAARVYRIRGWARLREVYVPAIFPYLVTGWVTAAGGAWNASIVAEYVSFQSKVMSADGLGSRISAAADKADFPMLAASVVAMSAVVVLFNRTVWRTCYKLADEKFSLNR